MLQKIFLALAEKVLEERKDIRGVLVGTGNSDMSLHGLKSHAGMGEVSVSGYRVYTDAGNSTAILAQRETSNA